MNKTMISKSLNNTLRDKLKYDLENKNKLISNSGGVNKTNTSKNLNKNNTQSISRFTVYKSHTKFIQKNKKHLTDRSMNAQFNKLNARRSFGNEKENLNETDKLGSEQRS
jgi:hypothetical protein